MSSPEITARDWKAGIPAIMMASLFVVYAFFFWRGVSGHWFNPDWVTDDSFQQIYPFHKVLHPGLFAGDLVTKMVECYFTPLHYWISYLTTWATGDPVMMGHWLMLFQIAGALIFGFLAVRHATGAPAAFFAVTWMLHTRYMIQRMAGGLPRGWSATVMSGFLYFLISGNHAAVLAMLFAGCLLHTPSTLVCALTYGFFLLWRCLLPSTRKEYLPRLALYALLSPIYLGAAWYIVKMPPEIGTMVTFEEASGLPEFQRYRPDLGIMEAGRFPFVPLVPAGQEIRTFAFEAFVGRFYRPGPLLQKAIRPAVIGIFVLIIGTSLFRRRKILPSELYFFIISAWTVYFASRFLAFQLYVPDRHLQFPMTIFYTIAYSIAAWRFFYPMRNFLALGHPGNRFEDRIALDSAWRGMLGLFLLGSLILASSGLQLTGSANFNASRESRGRVFPWISRNTPESSLIAGHPTSLDTIQLFGMRKGYVTTETSHPFYSKYREEMRRRLEIAFRANYAKDLEELVAITQPEGIDYFLFDRRLFYENRLREAEYFPPLNPLVKELAGRPVEDYAYRKLPLVIHERMTPENAASYPYIVYWDKRHVLVDLRKLEEALKG